MGEGGKVEIHWKVTCVINFGISWQSVKKSILEHFPKFLTYFIIICWNFNHKWLTTYVDACNLQNWKKLYKEKNWCNFVIWSQNAKKPLAKHLFTIFLNYYNWVKFHPHMTNQICRCLQFKKSKRKKKEKKLMQLYNLDRKCHMLGNP